MSGTLTVHRPRARLVLVVFVTLAVLLGLVTGLAPRATLAGVFAALSALVLVPRLEWAALAVISTAVFESYLDRIDPWAAQWLVAVLLVAWAVRRAAGPLHGQSTAIVLAPAGVFAAVLLLAAVGHPHGTEGLAVVARYAVMLAVLVVLVDCLSGPLEPRRAAQAYVVSCVLAALCGLVTAVVTDGSRRVAGPLSSPDDLAFFLVAALPLAGAVVGAGRRSWWRAFAATGVLVLGVLGTGSRGAWLALAVIVVIALATGVLSLRAAGALVVVVATGLAFVFAVLPRPAGDALTAQQRYAETRLSQRADLWEAAAAMTRDHPALGLGPGAFAIYHDDYRSSGTDRADLLGRDLDEAHSTPLQASAELGVLGAATLLGVFVVPVLAARRRWRRDRSWLTASAGLALTGLVVASVLATEQYRLPLWFLAALTAALGQRYRRRVLVIDQRWQPVAEATRRPDPHPGV